MLIMLQIPKGSSGSHCSHGSHAGPSTACSPGPSMTRSQAPWLTLRLPPPWLALRLPPRLGSLCGSLHDSTRRMARAPAPSTARLHSSLHGSHLQLLHASATSFWPPDSVLTRRCLFGIHAMDASLCRHDAIIVLLWRPDADIIVHPDAHGSWLMV